MEDRCVCCGAIVQVGRHVCTECYQNKFFPVIGSNQRCQPKGLCIICGEPFFKIEYVGWVKPTGKQCKQYYHARCFKSKK